METHKPPNAFNCSLHGIPINNDKIPMSAFIHHKLYTFHYTSPQINTCNRHSYQAMEPCQPWPIIAISFYHPFRYPFRPFSSSYLHHRSLLFTQSYSLSACSLLPQKPLKDVLPSHPYPLFLRSLSFLSPFVRSLCILCLLFLLFYRTCLPYITSYR